MARRKRTIVVGRPHHVTQRGVRRQNVFFDDEDRHVYLRLLKEQSIRYKVEIVGYCLMTNHVHLMLVPYYEDSLWRAIQGVHKRYADYLNAKMGWTGHAWQEKFYSSPVDEQFFWVALRYIEQNPLVAKMVKHPADYKWSSAAGHCGRREDPLLTRREKWCLLKLQVVNWESWVIEEEQEERIHLLRECTSRDLPTGSEKFLDKIERKTGRSARAAKRGRPKKSE
ncbi:transposase [bacterium]|nr:transposase [bacterium]